MEMEEGANEKMSLRWINGGCNAWQAHFTWAVRINKLQYSQSKIHSTHIMRIRLTSVRTMLEMARLVWTTRYRKCDFKERIIAQYLTFFSINSVCRTHRIIWTNNELNTADDESKWKKRQIINCWKSSKR